MEQRIRQLEETVAFLEKNIDELDAFRAEIEQLVVRVERLERMLSVDDQGARTSASESPLDL